MCGSCCYSTRTDPILLPSFQEQLSVLELASYVDALTNLDNRRYLEKSNRSVPVVIPAGMSESSARDGEIDRRTCVWSNGVLIDYPKTTKWFSAGKFVTFGQKYI